MGWSRSLPEGGYRACWRDEAGTKRSRNGFTSAKAARTYADEQEKKLAAGKAGASTMTWAEWMPIWLQMRGAARQTDKDDLSVITKWLVPRWGPVELCEIKRKDVKLWLAEVATMTGPPTVRRVLVHLSGSINHAIEAELLEVNPCYRIKTPPIAQGTERFFTHEEFDAAHAHLTEPYASFELGLVETGMRFSELAALHEERVDRANKMIDVLWAFGGSVVEPTKGRNRRGVPISDRLLAALPPRSAQRTCGQVHSASAGPCRSGLVFLTPEGAVLDDKNVLTRHWYPALDAAGVARGRQHDLRHTFASWMIQNGMGLDRIAELLGHTSSEVTKRYAHLGGVQIEQAREILNRRSVVDLETAAAEESAAFLPHRRNFKIIPGGA